MVPLAAVKGPPRDKFVMVREQGELVRRPVKTGVSTRTEVQILSGLNEGDEIVSGQASAVAGTKDNNDRGFGGPMGGPPMRGPRG